MGSRKGLSTLLIVGALVLVAAIAVGNSMGTRVLDAVAGRSLADLATPIPTPAASADDVRIRQNLRRKQVLSVATDPAFADPRITPEPTLAPTAEPTYAPRRHRYSEPAAAGAGGAGGAAAEETAPPLVYPSDDATDAPEAPAATAPPEQTAPAATVQPAAPATAAPVPRRPGT